MIVINIIVIIIISFLPTLPNTSYLIVERCANLMLNEISEASKVIYIIIIIIIIIIIYYYYYYV